MRRLFGLQPAPEFRVWLEERGIVSGGQLAIGDSATHPLLGELQALIGAVDAK
jgi:ethanolamine ammonia-lyase large subunit